LGKILAMSGSAIIFAYHIRPLLHNESYGGLEGELLEQAFVREGGRIGATKKTKERMRREKAKALLRPGRHQEWEVFEKKNGGRRGKKKT